MSDNTPSTVEELIYLNTVKDENIRKLGDFYYYVNFERKIITSGYESESKLKEIGKLFTFDYQNYETYKLRFEKFYPEKVYLKLDREKVDARLKELENSIEQLRVKGEESHPTGSVIGWIEETHNLRGQRWALKNSDDYEVK